jgi:hypothetical protein
MRRELCARSDAGERIRGNAITSVALTGRLRLGDSESASADDIRRSG